MKLQNKRIKNVQIYIFKRITLLDLPILLGLFFLAASIGFSIGEKVSVLWKMLLTFTIFTITGTPLIKHYKHWNLKGYKILWYFILFHSRPKTYSKSTKTNANTQNLVPYIKVEKKFVKISGGYIAGIELKGQDIFSIGSQKIEQILEQMTIALNAVSNKVTIVKIAQQNDLTKNKIFLEKNFDTCSKKLNEDFCKNYEQDILDFDSYLQHKYFIIIYEKNIQTLIQQFNLLSSNIGISGFSVKPLTVEDLLNINKKCFNYFDKLDESEYESISQGDNISKYLCQSKIQWFKNHFKINENFFSIQSINEYPFRLPLGWAAQLFGSDSNVIWHLSRLTSHQKEVSFNRGAKNLESNLNENRNIVLKSKTYNEQMALEQIVDVAGSSREEIFYSTFLFLNYASSLEKLKEAETVNKNSLKNIGATVNNLKYRQLQAFTQLYFRFSNSLHEEIEMPASNIVFGVPFISRSFNDNNFNVIATSKNDYSPLFFDIFKQNQDRKNSNTFILGTSGAGKSTLTKKLITYNLGVDNSVIVLDPQNEYWKIADFAQGNTISFGSDSSTIFNPLQIQKVFSPQAKPMDLLDFNNYETIVFHLQTLEKFFAILLPNLKHNIIMSIVEVVNKLYSQLGFYQIKEDITTLESDKFPTIDDLITLFEKCNFDYLTARDKSIALATLIYEFKKPGKLSKLFNGKSSDLDLSKNLTIFNVATLMHLEKRVYQAGFFLILSYIEGRIASNYHKNKKILLVVDEAHKFIDENNTIALDFLFKIAKTIRKYNGAIMITTQNPGDFAISGEQARKSEAIIENCQYSFFFNLKNNDIEKVDKLFTSSGGLTTEEKKFLAIAQIGDFIFSINSNERYLCSSYFNHSEKQLFFDQGNKFEKKENSND